MLARISPAAKQNHSSAGQPSYCIPWCEATVETHVITSRLGKARLKQAVPDLTVPTLITSSLLHTSIEEEIFFHW